MRIAFCVSGQPRFFEKGYSFFKTNLFDTNSDCQIDTFIHSWFDSDKIGTPYDSSSWNINRSDVVRADTQSRINELYAPKKMILEKQRHFPLARDYSSFMAKTPPHILFSLSYSIMQSIELKRSYELENGFTYDWVIRGRFDWALMTPIKLSNYDNNGFNIPGDIPGDDMNDQFAFSSSANMDHYAKLHHNIDDIWVAGKTRLSGESLLGRHLLNSNTPILRQDINYSIIRQKALQQKEIGCD